MQTPADGLKRILEALGRFEIPYMVGGSAASSLHGMDFYLVLDLRADQVEGFAAELKSDFYADPE